MASVSHSDVEGVRVVSLRGALDHEGVRPVEAAFESATAPGSRVVVDLSDVDMLTTPGISMLVAANQRIAGSGGRVVVTGASGFVDDLLRRCRLDQVLKVVDGLKDAVKVARG